MYLSGKMARYFAVGSPPFLLYCIMLYYFIYNMI